MAPGTAYKTKREPWAGALSGKIRTLAMLARSGRNGDEEDRQEEEEEEEEGWE